MPDEVPTLLYRPVGQAEFELIRASGFRTFPPRLPQQPFFYPVLSEGYATQIAGDWNTKDESSGFIGYALFRVRTEFLNSYEIHLVGGAERREYWILRRPGESERKYCGSYRSYLGVSARGITSGRKSRSLDFARGDGLLGEE